MTSDDPSSAAVLVGLVGTGIQTSFSPPLHHAEADQWGLRYLYRRLDLDVLQLQPTAVGEVVRAAQLAGYTGLNITHPCKQLVIDHLDGLSPEAERLGAVNTVVFTDGSAIGHNTDASGFIRSFRRGLPNVRTGRIVLLGAGGAGAAIAHALLDDRTEHLVVLDLNLARVEALVGHLEATYGTGRASGGTLDQLPRELTLAAGLVHATPTGMAAHPGSAVPAELLRASLWVADIVYRPLHTQLLGDARAAGCQVLDGGGMVALQSADSFRLFTGITPDEDRMLAHLTSLIDAEGSQHLVPQR